MAAVEKRKNAFVGLLLNHLMFMFICAFIMLPLNGAVKIIFGVIMCFIYYYGVYDYCFKAGREHSRSYTETSPSPKFPFYYGIIGNIFFWLPVIIVLISGNFSLGDAGTIIMRLFYIVWDSPFIFTDVFTSTDFNALNLFPVLTFSLLYFAASFSGYYMGKQGSSLIGIINRKFGKIQKKNKESK